MKKKTKIKLIILSALVLLNLTMNAFGNALQIEHYSLASDKLTEPVCIVFISDLHNCTYGGSDQSGIWEKIQAEEPDLVLFGGDMVDQYGGTAHALRLMEMTKETYPCAYTSGNHEVDREDTEEFYDEVETLGIPVLHGNEMDVTVNGQALRISGFIHAYENPDQFESCCQSLDDDRYNVLLVHQPEQFESTIAKCTKHGTEADLVLSGHAHGGQWRIPKLLEHGLFAPDQGIFPEFTGGQRTEGGTVQITSRGLAKPFRMLLIPRIFNRPELSVVEILPNEPT
ncbi:MAG: metallophosphoesterase [Oscillospiraceae bacterium]|nr:metallophosphoesterase [Oscillospiraceae bacterium]